MTPTDLGTLRLELGFLAVFLLLELYQDDGSAAHLMNRMERYQDPGGVIERQRAPEVLVVLTGRGLVEIAPESGTSIQYTLTQLGREVMKNLRYSLLCHLVPVGWMGGR